LLSALSETLSGASFSGGAGAAEVIASQEVIAESIAQVADGFAVAVAADGSAALSLPDPTSVLRQDNQNDSGSGNSDVVKSQPTKTVDDLIREATPGRKTLGTTKQYNLKGGYQEALDDFQRLDLEKVKPIAKGKLGWLSDGRVVNVRGDSSGGMPTLEIYNPITEKSIKFRYIGE
jgi:hypothetical protein